jgi:RNA polymerase primary sigma factor/RNA polymerase sporulation-specific sigma factor
MARDYEKSNEALVILAQRGCEAVKEKALNLLLRRNEGLIYDTVLTYWNYVLSSDIDRSLTLDDLAQLGRIKFCDALSAFDPLRGTKLTTFMTAVLNNYLIDTIRPGLKEKEDIGGEFLWLDHYEGSENQLTFLEKHIDPYQRRPEPILLEKEHRQEVFDSLDACTAREKTYLAYRFGYPSDDERTKAETRDHFGLSETRAEKLEQQACNHFKENYNEIQRKAAESLQCANSVSVHSGDCSGCSMIIRWI